MFSPRLVAWAESEKSESLGEILKEIFGSSKRYISIPYELSIEWVPIGTKFFVNDYDGYENVRRIDQIEWTTA